MIAAGTTQEWSLGHEGISAGWAFFVFLVLMAVTIFVYLKFVPDMPKWRRYSMIALRGAVIAVLLVLLVKPVVNLTLNEPVRQNLFVLLDTSQSMSLADKRQKPDDLKRAALATGILDPAKGLAQELPKDASAALATIPRWDLLEKLAANEKLNLWSRLGRQADLVFYQFGREATQAGAPEPAASLTATEAAAFFKGFHPDKPATAIGDSLRQILQDGRPAAGILLITDGDNNSGLAPVEAAALAREQKIPLYIYGVGVISPPDLIVEDVTVPRLAFVKERLDVRAKIRSQGIENQSVTASLMANGLAVDEQSVTLGPEGEYEVMFHYQPEEAGEAKLEVSLAVLPKEVNKDNNTLEAHVRVTEDKFNVLLIEQEPRWDFRYLLAYLQRDRRLGVKCVMIKGEPGLDKIEDSPFLPALPDDRAELFRSQVLILGDVDPKDLGDDRMEMIREWVEAGGGIIFLAGPNFNPVAYVGTPLEPLLPVVPDTVSTREVVMQRSPEPFKLQLTSLGETSSYLLMSPDPEENLRIWEKFPGARWTAPVARAKPGAEVLLVDPRPERAGRYGPQPVFALQGYGAGTSVYLGTDETWRWRSKTGEKYYSILWGQIMQSLSLQLLEGASSLIQLKTSQSQYLVGDKVTIAGNVYTQGFQPLIAPAVQGSVKFSNTSGKTTEQALSLSTMGKGVFRGEFVAQAPGSYSFSTENDPSAVLKFEVIQPRLEQLQTSLNEKMLRTMAEVSHGRFLREEDLNALPDLVKAKRETTEIFKKLDLYYSRWWLAALLVLLSMEWLLRRLTQLK